MDDNNLSFFIINNIKKGYNDISDEVLKKWSSKANPKYYKNDDINDYYRGTFTIDEILSEKKVRLKINKNIVHKKKHDVFAFIINTLHSYSKPNDFGHWLAIIIEKNNQNSKVTVRYFDSYGRPPYIFNCIWSYIQTIKRECNKNNFMFELDYMQTGIQSYTSKFCGVYCAYFLIKSWHFGNKVRVREIFKGFDKNRKKNDLKIEAFIKKYYPSQYCHDYQTFSNRKVSLNNLLVKPHALSYKSHPPFCSKKTFGLSHCFKKGSNCKCKKC